MKATLEVRGKGKRPSELAQYGRPASADVPGESVASGPEAAGAPLINALSAFLAVVAKGKGGKGKGG